MVREIRRKQKILRKSSLEGRRTNLVSTVLRNLHERSEFRGRTGLLFQVTLTSDAERPVLSKCDIKNRMLVCRAGNLSFRN